MSDTTLNIADIKTSTQQSEQFFLFLASVFLTLPDQDFICNLSKLNLPSAGSAGCDEIAKYASAVNGQDTNQVLLDLGKDRARLIRGMGLNTISAPYECNYTHTQQGDIWGSLNRFYREAGYVLDHQIHDAPDQIGVEFAFLANIFAQKAAAADAYDVEAVVQWDETLEHFMSQHLGRWAHEYGQQMATHAQTGFYRGIGLLITETFN